MFTGLLNHFLLLILFTRTKRPCIVSCKRPRPAKACFSIEGPEKFSHPKSRSKLSNLAITELFYSRILNMNRGPLHTRCFRRIQLSVFKNRLTKNGFAGPKSFRAFRETGPCWAQTQTARLDVRALTTKPPRLPHIS